jgi:tetratricopeptide (TPR) repeat protein
VTSAIPVRSLERAQKLVEEYERRLGPRNPQTLLARVDLARSYRKEGDLSKAEKILEGAIPELTQSLGSEEPDTLRALQLYAVVLGLQGKLTRAKPIQQQLVTSWKGQKDGDDSPDTLLAIRNLARLLDDLQEWEELKSVQELLIVTLGRMKGKEHPDTIQEMANEAQRLRCVDQMGAALALQERVCELYTTVLGGSARETLRAKSAWAMDLVLAGRGEQARVLGEEALRDAREKLSADDPFRRHVEEGAIIIDALLKGESP